MADMPSMPGDARLADRFGRTVNYMRISVTDRCNLRCFYCRSGPELPFIPHDQVMRYEEILELMGLAKALGVRKIRLTGGEPFARRDFLPFLERAVNRHPEIDLRLTTNATLLSGVIPRLKDMGLSHLNISLDSLNPKVYERVTGLDAYAAVRRAIDESLDAGITVKLNAVALRGVNDSELPAFMEFLRATPLDLRFIEFMPMGAQTAWRDEHFWPAEDILARARDFADLTLAPRPDPAEDGAQDQNGPARMFSIAGGLGRLGLISPLSRHFCETCNRLRITSSGTLRTCLFSDKEYRLLPALRHNKLGAAAVERIMRLASLSKPMGHVLLEAARERRGVAAKIMSSIGG